VKAWGWIFLIGGFAWIVFVAATNPIMTSRMGWLNEMEPYLLRDHYTSAEVYDAMSRVGNTIKSKQRSPLWGGLAMLFGATLTSFSKGKARG
jgi:hypothetical protein